MSAFYFCRLHSRFKNNWSADRRIILLFYSVCIIIVLFWKEASAFVAGPFRLWHWYTVIYHHLFGGSVQSIGPFRCIGLEEASILGWWILELRAIESYQISWTYCLLRTVEGHWSLTCYAPVHFPNSLSLNLRLLTRSSSFFLLWHL